MQAKTDSISDTLVSGGLMLALGALIGAGVSLISRRPKHPRNLNGAVGFAAPDEHMRVASPSLKIESGSETDQGSEDHERELRLLTDAIPALLLQCAPDGEQRYANNRFYEYIGQPVDRSAGGGWLEFLHPDDVEPLLRFRDRAFSSGRPLQFSYRLRRHDGVYRWFDVLAAPLRDDTGEIVRWYVVLFDVDDRKRTEDALRATRASLHRATQAATVAELSASIAHEINQPLAAILANGEACKSWLARNPPNVDRALCAMERLLRDGKAAAEVVSRIRKLFQQAAPEKEPLDMNEVVKEVINLTADEISKRRVSVVTEFDTSNPTVFADRIQMQQVFTNIITNALEAMDGELGRSKLLSIRSGRTGSTLYVEVRDTGHGFHEPSMMFEPFFTTKTNGMGMGLAICRAIVDSHGGRLWASMNPDFGVTVSFILPLQSEAA